MKTTKQRLKYSLPVLIIFLCWAGMAFTDYTLSLNAHAPVFARKVNAADADIYRGLGYTIVIDDGYAVSPPGAELKGRFYWGWL